VLRINTNVAAINTQRQVRLADHGVSKALERLSSGLRVNRASDDAAGLAISEKLRGQVRGSQRAAANMQDAISLVNVADGALTEVHSALQRMRELAVQAANGTLSTADRAANQAEFAALQAEIGSIAANTTFNNRALFVGRAGAFATANFNSPPQVVPVAGGTTTYVLAGPPTPYSSSALNSVTLTAQASPPPAPPPPAPAPPAPPPQTLVEGVDFTRNQTLVGYNGTTPLYQYSLTVNNANLTGDGPFTLRGTSNQTYPTSNLPIEIEIQAGANFGQTEILRIPPINTGVMGVGSTVSLSNQTQSQLAIAAVDRALSYVSSARGTMGATSRSLEHGMNAVLIGRENMDAAFSRIRDNDMATDMTNLTRQQILTQSSLSMLAIANDSRTILGLFS
jgi:flagellin